MVHFVGAGPGAVDLITVRGQRLLSEADVIIYAGSLVNPELLSYAKENCMIYDSAGMNLEGILYDCNDRRHCRKCCRDAEQKQDHILRLGKISFQFIQINSH